MAIDMANLEDRIAIEFDGPSHFLGLVHDGRIDVGKTKMKAFLLMNLGWIVINITVVRMEGVFFWRKLEAKESRILEEEVIGCVDGILILSYLIYAST